MATAQKTPRLLAAAKEFNIGKDTLTEYLTGKGFEINASNPNTKLTAEMYEALQKEFAQDKLAKRKSEEIALPKGSLLDNINKSKEDLDISARGKEEGPAKEEPKAKAQSKKAEEAPAPAKVVEPKKEEQPAPPVVEAKEEPKKEEPKPVVEEKKEEAPVAKEEKKPVVEVKEEPKKEEAKQEEPTTTSSYGPKVLGKINLDEINKSTRPKKSEKKEEPKPVAKEEKKEEVKTQAEPKKEAPIAKEAPKVEEPKKETPKPVAKEEKKEEAKPKEEPKKETPAAKEAPKAEGPEVEHIRTRVPKLEGPKILGKIELPTKPTNDNKSKSDNNKEKRNRKRIPLQKKGGDNNRGGGDQQSQNRGNNNNRGGQHGNNDRRGAGGRNNDRRGGQHGNNDRRGGRNQQNLPPQEIDEKAIQDKIRQTQAKLAGGAGGRNKQNKSSKYRRNKREEMAEKRAAAEQAEQDKAIQVTEFISVSELASLLDVNFTDVISKCMSLGIMVSINQRLDAEVIELVSGEFGYEVEFINLEQEADTEEDVVDAEEDLEPRAPIVTIMGHVDHGKTSLLDYIRKANVVAGEAGGITQHIGAYRVKTESGKKITFLDTPGHEAFTAMRARGAKVADVAVIVIAADDAIMPQTKEAISHAQAASLPMVFAINKIDKDGANPDKIKEQLAGMNILVEDWGGNFQSQEISAKSGLNIDQLLEKITLEADLLDLKANPNRAEAVGSVIEASLDKGRGYQTTILVQSGTLRLGDMIVSGQYYGKVKAMFNERGARVEEAGPSTPVQVLGLNGAPQSGEKAKVFVDEDEAKSVANHRAQILREQGIRTRKHITLDEIGRRLALGNFKELSLIIKADFDGSVEALTDALQKLSTEEVAVNIVHRGVGQITESDVLLATASDAIILGFQVRPSIQASKLADQENIEIRYYSIIYDAIEEIKSAMEGLLEPKIERKTVSHVEIRETFKISGVGTIAGCYVMDGKMSRNTKINLVRDGIVVYTGELASLKRFKDDVKEVSAGYECGLSIKNYNDIRVGDVLEGFEEVEVKRTL